MASQSGPSSSTISNVEISSYVRGVHAYKDIWEPREGEVLLLRREPDNIEDKFAVAVMKSEAVVGCVPKTLAPVISQFLKRDCNKGVVRIAGKQINRGGGFGLEAPLIFCLYGPEAYLRRLKEVIDAAGGTASDVTEENPETRSQPFLCELGSVCIESLPSAANLDKSDLTVRAEAITSDGSTAKANVSWRSVAEQYIVTVNGEMFNTNQNYVITTLPIGSVSVTIYAFNACGGFSQTVETTLIENLPLKREDNTPVILTAVFIPVSVIEAVVLIVALPILIGFVIHYKKK